jgi:hypothetical protein
LVALDGDTCASSSRDIYGYSFGSESVPYNRGLYMILASPYITSRASSPITIESIRPATRSGCSVRLRTHSILAQAEPNDEYAGSVVIPPWESNRQLRGVRDQAASLVIRHSGGADWYYIWKIEIPTFCKLVVTGYDVRFEEGRLAGRAYLPQATTFIPTTRITYPPHP